MAGDQELAERASRGALARFREAGDERGATEMIFRLGVTAFHTGDNELGRRLTEESLAAFERLGDEIGQLQVLGNLGWLESEEGNRERGRALTLRSLELSRQTGWTWFEAGQLAELAERSLEDGRTDDGARYAVDCLTIARRIEDRETTLFALAALAWAAAQRGDADRSAALWAAVEAEEARGGRMGRWEESRARYAANIADAPRPTAAMDLDQAAEYALTP